MDRKKSWREVDQIIQVLNTACTFLDFKDDAEFRHRLVVDQERTQEAIEEAAAEMEKLKSLSKSSSK